jgi:hypothetical protein
VTVSLGLGGAGSVGNGTVFSFAQWYRLITQFLSLVGDYTALVFRQFAGQEGRRLCACC